ncbi:translation protein SH3-like domain-containing protein [Gloeopeniophorella convolvens]|nr:translation protein SH3-like domain-containing protein [Gloeopeniophorella convolvens]
MSFARLGVGLLKSRLTPLTLQRFPAPSLAGSLLRRYATEATPEQRPTDVNAALSRTETLFKTYKPVTPGIRHLRRPLNPHIFKGRPLRVLTVALRKKGGRNSYGRITVRSRGGGHRRRIRIVDFMRIESGPHDVVRIEYDPNRSAHIALIRNRDPNVEGTKKWSYILACEGLRAGHVIESFRQGIPDGLVEGFVDSKNIRGKMLAAEDGDSASANASLAIGLLRARTVKPGNVLPLRLIPTGTIIHSIALNPEGRGILVRSAGSFGQVIVHEDNGRYTQVRLQSGEVRKVLQDCVATIGKVSNPLWKSRSLGKAGRARWLGRRPHVRGVAMNAVDHPHGGGRGKSKSNKHPRSIWGWLTKGKRTRKPGPKGPKGSNKMVVRERPRGVEKRRGR